MLKGVNDCCDPPQAISLSIITIYRGEEVRGQSMCGLLVMEEITMTRALLMATRPASIP